MPTEANPNIRVDPADLPGEAVIFGCTSAMHEVRSKIDQLCTSDLPVLIQGESGTGKEVIARFLHSRSSRCRAPFVKLNCAAVPAYLLDKELFGCEIGPHENADGRLSGLAEIADAGTLFLDEVGAMDSNLQGKLLCLLRDGSDEQAGLCREDQGRLRVICATNVDLQRGVEMGTFRRDLLCRIDVVHLRLPALRERKKDIPQLCEYFLRKLSRQFNRTAPNLKPATLKLLMQWDWPGNLRELENWVARAIVYGDDAALSAELGRRVSAASAVGSLRHRSGTFKETERWSTSDVTTAVILRMLRANHWNRRKTAVDLNMSYRALLYRLREAGLPQRRRGHRGFPSAQ
jgi:two-component system, NtrC family, response regulator AtoC